MRIEGWEKLLSEYLEAQATVPFEWGVSDCLMFAADAVKLITGIDPAEEARGRYNDVKSAAILSIETGIKTEEIFDRHFERGDVAFSHRGDIVLKETDRGATFGIVYGGKAVFKVDGVGLSYEPLMSVGISWRVE